MFPLDVATYASWQRGLKSQLLTAFLLLFSRVLGLFSSAPILSQKGIPWPIKAGLAATVTLLLLPLATLPEHGARSTEHGARSTERSARSTEHRLCAPSPCPLVPLSPCPLGPVRRDLYPEWPAGYLGLGCEVAKEFLLGAFLGFLLNLLLAAVQWAAYLLDFQMGFGFVSAVDPLNDTQTGVLSRFLTLLVTLLFLEFNGHHLLFRGLGYTLAAIPLGEPLFSPEMGQGLTQMLTRLFLFAARLVLPAALLLALVDFGLSIVGRVLPQLDVFLIGMPLKTVLGLFLLVLTLPVLDRLLLHLLTQLDHDLRTLLLLAR